MSSITVLELAVAEAPVRYRDIVADPHPKLARPSRRSVSVCAWLQVRRLLV